MEKKGGSLSTAGVMALLEGFRRGLPIVLGYMPVGFAFGVLGTKSGIPPALIIAMSVLMFSGSGQFVFASLWGHGSGVLSTSIAVAIVNLRYLLMSLAETPWFTGLSFIKKFFLGCGITDETFVVHAAALAQGWRLNTLTMFACNYLTQLAWVSGCAIGAFFGGLVTDVRPWGLDYAITAMFIALLVPQCASRLHLLVAIFSLCLSIALKAAGMTQWNVAIATIAGASLGLLLSELRNSKNRVQPNAGN